MDATNRPLQIPKELFAYAEKNRILEIFQNMFQRLTVDRPGKPIDYLYDLLMKGGIYNVPKVFVLGPPTVDRKLVCTTLASRLHLVYITQNTLLKELENEDEFEDQSSIPYSTWVKLVKKRVAAPDCMRKGWLMEAFPRTRRQAFALRKAGVFPSHIVVIEDPAATYQGALKNNSVQSEEDKEELLQFVTHRRLILDLHKNSYVKTFHIQKYPAIDATLNKVLEFVRSKQRPSLPYLPRVLFLGPYGSGRKTMAKKLSEKYNLIQIDYQEELRRAALKDSPLKKKFYEVLKTSEPVPDELLVQVAADRLLQEDCIEKGYVMINFPDTRKQAELLVHALEGFQVNRVIFLGATLWTCLERVEPRRLDPSTGQTYHLKRLSSIPRVAFSRLIQLPQDLPDSVRAEHDLYSLNVAQLRDFYRTELIEDITTEVDANASLESVFETVQAAILTSTKIKFPS